MLVSHEHRCVVLHNPKTAGVALEQLLIRRAGFVPVGDTERFNDGDRVHFRHHWRIPEAMAAYRVVTGCRHPVTRYLSGWRYYIRERLVPPCDLEVFLRRHGQVLPDQARYVGQADVVLPIERMPDCLAALPFLSARDRAALPCANATDTAAQLPHVRRRPDLVQAIADLYAEDWAVLAAAGFAYATDALDRVSGGLPGHAPGRPPRLPGCPGPDASPSGR